MKSASARSSGMLPRCACSTRTACASIRSTFHTPWPALPRFCFSTRGPAACQPRGEFVPERAHRTVDVGVGPPAEVPGAVEDFLHAHLEDHVGMRADPRAAGRDIAQQRIEHGARLAGVERIDPDEHAVDPEELVADLVGEGLVEYGRLGVGCRSGSVPRTRGDSDCSAASPRGASPGHRARPPRPSVRHRHRPVSPRPAAGARVAARRVQDRRIGD